MTIQDAALHGPGRFCAVVVYGLRTPDPIKARQLLVRVARLLAVREAKPNWHRDLHVLVAVSDRLLKAASIDLGMGSVALPNPTDFAMPVGNGQGDVFVQIAAPVSSDRIRGLDLAHEILANHHGDTDQTLEVRFDFELLGEPRVGLTEPFGYRDGQESMLERIPASLRDIAVEDPTRRLASLNALFGTPIDETRQSKIEALLASLDPKAVLPTTAKELEDLKEAAKQDVTRRCGMEDGTTWLVFQRYNTKIDKFVELDVAERDNVMGVTRGRAAPSPSASFPPSDSHVAVVKAHGAKLQRRGFSFREAGVDGLSFVGLAKTPADLEAALLAMATKDNRLLEFVTPVSGGFYFVPPDAAWLLRKLGSVTLAPVDLPARVTRHVRDEGATVLQLVDYSLVPQVLEYLLLARGRGAFIEPTMHLRPDLDTLMEAFEAVLAGATVGPLALDKRASSYDSDVETKLRSLRETVRQASEAHYLQHGRYLTLGI